MIAPPYNVLYVDPPWQYVNKATGGSHVSGAEQKYSTLTLADLCALPVQSVLARDAVLALWATVPIGPDPFYLMAAWGFTYKTTYYWIKTGRLGMGHYFRGQVEPLLFGIRGKVKPFRLMTERNYKQLPPLRHSAKPPYFRELVERATRALPARRLELFAREQAPGWDATGLELDGRDIRDVLQEASCVSSPSARVAAASAANNPTRSTPAASADCAPCPSARVGAASK